MDPKSILDTVLTCWDRTAKYRKYIRSLGHNLADLRSKMEELDNIYRDVDRDVSAAEGRRWIRTDEVRGWLGRVEAHKKEVDKILADGTQIMKRNCLCGLCCWNCRPRYQHSELAEKKISDLEEELVRHRDFRDKGNVAYEPADLILETSLEALRRKRDELRAKFETVKEQVKREEKRHLVVRTPEVDVWWKSVEDLLRAVVPEILDKAKAELEKNIKDGNTDQSPRNSALYHGIAKRADECRTILEGKLRERDGFKTLTCKHDEAPIHELPLECYVGEESIFKEVWNWVEDEAVRCIGIVGKGGAGKTTLLYKVNNEFLQVPQHHYDFSVLIVVSRPLNLDRIQEAILKELGVPEDKWRHRDRKGRASVILTYMKEKNFLLFLDDLWDSIDLLNDLGIPTSDHPKKCKIIFTTRDRVVSKQMQPDKTKEVDCLPRDEALRLFRLMLGEKTWDAHPMVPKIAATLVHECKYLPLAIVTMARAMTGTTELNEWMDAKKDMKSRVSKFPGMEKKVLVSLEFSYERLPDDIHRMCFRYLSIFPEDHEISEGDAIDLWIGEGFLSESGKVREERSYGAKIFARLRNACLVEFVRSSSQLGKIFKMHDLVREMALWVETEHMSKKNRVLVQERLQSFTSEDLEKWKEANRISLWSPAGNRLYDSWTTIPKSSCSYLSTLIIRNSSLKMIPEELFLSMPSLRVLELSHNNYIGGLPDSIWKLTNLRYLNLDIFSRELIVLVPEKMKNLSKLEVLILSRLFVLPGEFISPLSSLIVFRWSDRYPFSFKEGGEIEQLEAVQMVHNLQELSLTLSSVGGFDKLLGCPKLHMLLRELHLYHCDGFHFVRISSSQVRRMKFLQSLTLTECLKLEQIQIDITGEHDEGTDGSRGKCSLAPTPSTFASPNSFHSLRNVLIIGCHSLVDVTSLIYHAPILETLHIELCADLEEVIVGDVEDGWVTKNRVFPFLVYLRLSRLRRLKRICRRALPFPALREIHVLRCPQLKKLPLNCDNAKNTLEAIKGEKWWWERLEWEHDAAAKQLLSPKFVSSSGEIEIW